MVFFAFALAVRQSNTVQLLWMILSRVWHPLTATIGQRGTEQQQMQDMIHGVWDQSSDRSGFRTNLVLSGWRAEWLLLGVLYTTRIRILSVCALLRCMRAQVVVLVPVFM